MHVRNDMWPRDGLVGGAVGSFPLRGGPGAARTRARPHARIEPSTVDGWVVVVVAGEIDVATAGELRGVLVDAVGPARWVVVDLSSVTFIDCTGLSVLAMVLRAARRAGGALRLVTDPDTPVARVLTRTALDRVFDLHESVAGAVASRTTVAVDR